MPRTQVNLDEVRKKYIQETDKLAQTRRFGLFSHPPSLAIGDNSYTNKIQNRKDPESGRVVVNPRNVQVGCEKKGKSKSSYFHMDDYKEDKYIDAPKLENQKNLERMAGIPKDKGNFRDASGWKTVCKAPYPHKSEFKGEKPMPDRTDDGRVIVKARNVQVAPKAKELYKFSNTFMKDEYDRMEIHEKKLRQKSASMRIGAPFRNMHGGCNQLNKDKNVYGTNIKFPEKKTKQREIKGSQHEGPFKPSNPNKHGWEGTLAKFPKYMENPEKKLTRKEPPADKKEIFKPNTLQQLARPNSSISCHHINIRRERMGTTLRGF